MLRHAKSGRATLGLHHVVSPLFALLPQRPANQAFIIDDQNLFRWHRTSLFFVSNGLELRLLHFRQNDREPAAFAHSACHFDTSRMILDDAFRQRQSKSRSFALGCEEWA